MKAEYVTSQNMAFSKTIIFFTVKNEIPFYC